MIIFKRSIWQVEGFNDETKLYRCKFDYEILKISTELSTERKFFCRSKIFLIFGGPSTNLFINLCLKNKNMYTKIRLVHIFK